MKEKIKKSLIVLKDIWCISKSDDNTIEQSSPMINSLAPKILTKKEDLEKVQPYLDKLNETIKDDFIHNVAITGGYGSGKSTIIKTFQYHNQQYNYLNISLASFNKKKIEDEKLSSEEIKKEKEELERLLEVSILQQIFYRVKSNEIPESRFKRIENIPNYESRGKSFAVIFWIISLIILLKFGYLDKINPKNLDYDKPFDGWAIFWILIVFIGMIIFSKKITHFFSNSKISKVNIKGELELGEDVNKSVFNEHLEEILYFFEKTKYNVVIIEDLDRFDSTDIFTKLREINLLINNAKTIGRKITFVYAVGDDLFKDKKERVKFFEFIIPIIPFINSSNADEQLKTLIEEAKLQKNIFTTDFISDITTFIDDIDMRLLINIFHEFVIYRNVLNPDLIKKNDELFAIITYKNIDPEDFTLLQRKEGKLYQLLNNKKIYIQKSIQEKEQKIQEITTEIEHIEKENVSNIKELQDIYFLKILSKLPSNALISGIERDFEKIIQLERIKYKYQGYNYLQENEHSFNFSEIEKEVNSEFTYQQRVELIKSKQNDKINTLKREIEKLKQELFDIEKWDLQQIFQEVEIGNYVKDFSNNRLLRNLIINGYINENYNDYISLFHEVSMSKNDWNFVRSVKASNSSPFDYPLDKIENIIDKIPLKYFEREAILNFDLVSYLIQNHIKYSDRYKAIINLLSNERKKSIQFIDEYIKNEERPLDIFIQNLVENWSNFGEYVAKNYGHNRAKIDEYLLKMITYANSETILNTQSHRFLKEMIETNSQFLSLVKKVPYQKISTLLKGLEIKFDKLEKPTEETKKTFNFVYQNNLYKINPENILQMLLENDKNTSEENFYRANYSEITASKSATLKDYINQNLSEYVEKVYLKLEDNKFDNEEILVNFLNNEILKENLKTQIIQKVETKISDIDAIEQEEIQPILFKENKVLPNWENIVKYYRNIETLDENLISFLNYKDVYTELSKQKMPPKNDDFDYSSFRKELLLSEKLSLESYTNILKSNIYTRQSLAFENLDEDKIKYLVSHILEMTEDNFNRLKEYSSPLHITLVEKYFQKFLEISEKIELEGNDILYLLKSEKLTIDNKFNFITKIEEDFIEENEEIARIVGKIILEKNQIVEFDYNAIKNVVESLTEITEKINIILLFFDRFSDDELIDIISSIDSDYARIFEERKRPKFNNIQGLDKLFNVLKSRNMIKNYKVDNNRINVVANYQ